MLDIAILRSGGSGVRRVGVAPGGPANRQLLEPGSGGSLGPFTRGGAGLRRARPVVAFFAVVVVCYVLLAVALIGSGLAVTHLVAHDRVGHWDDHVNSWFARHRSKTWNSLSADLTVLAKTLGVSIVAAVLTVVLLIRRWGRFALLLLIGLGIELAVFLSTTYLVARPRPDVKHLGGTPSTFSWPSGHAAATLVLYGGIAVLVMVATSRRWLRVLAWTVAVALTLGVALSRIYRGEHHPTDTMAGVFLGAGALWAAVLALRASGLAARRPPAIDRSLAGHAQASVEPVAVGA
jgi:membrane-associated phospholipid phosphatase